MEYYLEMRKNEMLPFVALWMELEGIMLSEISQSEKDISCYYSYVETEKVKTEDHGRREGGKIVTNREGGRQTIIDF